MFWSHHNRSTIFFWCFTDLGQNYIGSSCHIPIFLYFHYRLYFGSFYHLKILPYYFSEMPKSNSCAFHELVFLVSIQIQPRVFSLVAQFPFDDITSFWQYIQSSSYAIVACHWKNERSWWSLLAILLSLLTLYVMGTMSTPTYHIFHLSQSCLHQRKWSQ